MTLNASTRYIQNIVVIDEMQLVAVTPLFDKHLLNHLFQQPPSHVVGLQG